MMDDCTCHPSSTARRKWETDCSNIPTVASVTIQNYKLNEIICIEGPFVTMARTLAIIKSTPRMIEQSSRLAMAKCQDWGYRTPYQGDKCFMGTREFTKSLVNMTVESAEENNQVFLRKWEQMKIQNKLNAAVLDGIQNCECSPKSEVGK